jgi:TPR repeat protein
MACLAHMAGVNGFMPSPNEARTQCDAASAQRNPSGLYLSWVLRRTAPHAGIDEATARARLAEAANLGWTSALINYGAVLAPDARAPVAAQQEAGRLWLAAAERGDPRGMFYYARWLRDSAAGPRDPAQAIPFLERAAARGQVDALHMLGTFYRDGIGATRNEARAKELYDRAARQNYPPSMFNLADMLRTGSAQDRARAIELFGRLACMRDEQQIQPMALARLRALQQTPACG